ncbi:MAG TPA: universal stress protein [Syntrophales bacterium]|nr:universal stress protein [Syntrophales bacterium]HOI17813.1 universal stress protein [Geobacteraceae bacterium]
MYKKVLIPLDGSPLAECVLGHLFNLAKTGNVGEVILIGVVEIPPGWAKEGVDFYAVRDTNIEETKVYLAKVKSDLAKEGISKVSTEVMVGKPADLISETAKKLGADLIIIATHGHTGISKWVFGSVADRVVHYSQIPVMVIRPEGCRL